MDKDSTGRLSCLVIFIFFTLILSTNTNAQVHDTTRPQLLSFSFNPTTVDVSSSPQTVTFTMRITDDLSGFSYGSFLLSSPSG
jgi:hypothetical protein